MVSAIRSLALEYHADVELQKLVALHPDEAASIGRMSEAPFVGVVRADLFFGTTMQMVELNTDYPDGFFVHDETSGEVANMVPDQALECASHADLFRALLTELGVRVDSHIFIGYNRGRAFRDECSVAQLALIKRGFMHVSVGALEDLEYRSGCFYHNGEKVDVIRRGAESIRLRSVPGLLPELAEAEQSTGLVLVNNLRMRLLGHKAMLAALHDQRFAHYLTAEEREAVARMVPYTQKLRRADLAALVSEQKEWVLKPSDDAEGEGVVVGVAVSPEAWRDALTEALKEEVRWIVQKRVEVPKDVFTFVDPTTGEVHTRAMHYDICPHLVLFKDGIQIGNTLVRFSDSALLNVSKGGGLTYAFREKVTSRE